jgi:hypothetical protein
VHGEFGCLAINRGRGRVDNANIRVLPASLEQLLRSENIVVRINCEVSAPTRPYAGLGSLMENDINAVEDPCIWDRIGIEDCIEVGFKKLKPLMAKGSLEV